MTGFNATAAMTGRLRQPDDAPTADPAKDKPPQDRSGRRSIPDHIPRQEIELTTGNDACAQCGGKPRRLGEDVTEELGTFRALHREPDRAPAHGVLRLRQLHPGPAAHAPDRARAPRARPLKEEGSDQHHGRPGCAPSRRSVEGRLGGQAQVPGAAGTWKDLTGNVNLLVEDVPLISMMLVDMQAETGHKVVGPYNKGGDALVAATDGNLYGGILDVNLNGEAVYPVAEVLVARKIPFVFITGYATLTIDERFHYVPVLQKPVELQNVRTALAAMRR